MHKCPKCGYADPKKVFLEGFVEFYKLYPKKAGKGAAEKKWSKLKPGFELRSLIMTSLADQIKNPTWVINGIAVFPGPAVWLHQKRWLDENKNRKQDGQPIDPQRIEQKKAELEALREKEWARRNAQA